MGEGVPFDPEGLLGTLPAIVNVTIGYYTGRYIQKYGKGYETISKLLLTGCLFVLIALCWNTVFPINKKLWTSSFVMLTTGIDIGIIGALLYIVEIKRWNPVNWTGFFLVFGKNPLFIYLLSEILLISISYIKTSPNQHLYGWVNNAFFQVIAPGAVGSLIFALFYMMICWLVGLWLYKKKIYVRV
jgi:predicted acyltransferase